VPDNRFACPPQFFLKAQSKAHIYFETLGSIICQIVADRYVRHLYAIRCMRADKQATTFMGQGGLGLAYQQLLKLSWKD
jgi:hypothetical protein